MSKDVGDSTCGQNAQPLYLIFFFEFEGAHIKEGKCKSDHFYRWLSNCFTQLIKTPNLSPNEKALDFMCGIGRLIFSVIEF